MIPGGDDCGFCAAMLEAACRQRVPGACELRTEYLTTPMDGDTAILRLADICPADMVEAVEAEAIRSGPPRGGG